MLFQPHPFVVHANSNCCLHLFEKLGTVEAVPDDFVEWHWIVMKGGSGMTAEQVRVVMRLVAERTTSWTMRLAAEEARVALESGSKVSKSCVRNYHSLCQR
jgi:hypothetical protein